MVGLSVSIMTIIEEYFFKYPFSSSLNAAFGYYTFTTPRFGWYTLFSFLNYFRYLIFIYIIYRPYPNPLGFYRKGLAYDYYARKGKPGLFLYLF